MSFSHPRRTTKSTPTAAALTLTPAESNTSGRSTFNNTMSLRKGSTFHHPTTPERELPHHLKVPSLPRRSQSSLEDVVDAHKRRVAITLGDIDRSLASAAEDSSPTVRHCFPDEADPVSRSILDHTVGPSIMDGLLSNDHSPMGRRALRPRSQRRPARYADSGLGSSISSSGKDNETKATSVSEDHCPAASAITKSAATHLSTLDSLPRLSVRATNRIHEHILRPLLAKPSLKDYHSIVRDCPRRIQAKEIVCLRDLEKTLMFMAPERTKSAKLYLDFCLTSIRCIQATVEFLHEREQTRETDRPYSNGYFVDLVDQINQYAQQVQATKIKEEKGENIGEMDADPTDEVRLFGGLTKNGRPAELVRVKKNGKAISIATGLPVDLDEDTKIQFKRSMSEEAEDDESILRSMARRKRSASAEQLAPKKCREPGCDKEFKRPCDLTKHEKTHSRPWKCPVQSCKYHEYGWPTEKEMDRHHNDKHSAAPPMYKCHFDCPYQSKRESNCKQHMEKAHGWTYVRSKNNGKNREKGGSTTGLPTPQMTNMQTPSSDGNTVNTPDDNMFPALDFDGAVGYDHSRDLNFPTYESDMFNAQLDMDLSPEMDLSPYSGSNELSPFEQSPYVENMDQTNFNENFHVGAGSDFNLYDAEDLYSANAQLPTPDHEVFQRVYQASGNPFASDPHPHISPIGQGNSMLYTPPTHNDLDDFNFGNGSDFQLFPSSASNTVSSTANSGLFAQAPYLPPGTAGKALLDFYDNAIAATKNGVLPSNNQMNYGAMDWMTDEGYSN